MCITVQMLALGIIGIPFYVTVRTGRRQTTAKTAVETEQVLGAA